MTERIVANFVLQQVSKSKYVAYTENETEIFIYHYGQHSCKAKHLNESPKSEVSKAISINPSVKPLQIQSNNIASPIRNERPWTEVEKIVKSFASIKNISNEKIKQKKILHPSFTAIDELKQHNDQKEKYIIYAFHENEQYVFKSSEGKMKMAQQMANASHYLHDEFCHFDGNHKRVKGFVTLTARVYYPLLKKQEVFLATMQCKLEDEGRIELFWRLLNRAYKEVNYTDTKFLPKGWYTDLATSNFTGLIQIYGEDVIEQFKGCEFHYKQSVEKRVKILKEHGSEFRSLALSMFESMTDCAYKNAYQCVNAFISSKAELSKLSSWLN